MNGLHSCKPGNEPVVGQVKTFTVIHNPATAQKKAWTKIKSASSDQGGTPYRITSVKPTGFTDSYGNISFNLDIEPSQQGSLTNGVTVPKSPSPQPSRGSVGNGGGKEGYWERKEAADIAKQPRIERQHAQEMALRYFGQRGGLEGGKKGQNDLRIMIDWFQRDVGQVPIAPHSTRDVEPDQIDIGGDINPPDEEIPF